MKIFAPYSGFAAVCAVLVFSTTGAAQNVKKDFTRPQTFDVKNYTVRASFDRTAKKVLGDTIVTLSPLKKALSTIELDSADIVYSEVSDVDRNTPLKFRTAHEKVFVELGRSVPTGQDISIRFIYVSTPTKGVYFQPPQIENGKEVRSAQIWSQGEADEAHHWFPSFDFPSDKATGEEYITANAGETVIGNGELIEKTSNADGSATWHFKMSIPHSTYLVSFVIGKYTAVNDKFGEIPLGYYVYPGRESIVPKAFGKTADILRVYEELTGVKFPYNKYDQTIVANFAFGGMENITATTLADLEVFLANFDFGKSTVEDLVSHEAAHSWFGDLVTCRNWAELWLNEGFATYMEAAYREKTYGHANYLIKVRDDASIFMADDAVNPRPNGLFNQNAGDIDKLFERSATVYNKGGAVLHMLREQVGEKVFWTAVHNYLEKNRFGTVESTDLKAAMEEASGQKLNWFFAQWVYGGGYPKLTVRSKYDAGAKTIRITVTQIQKGDKLVPEIFRMPMEVELKTADGTRIERLDVTKRAETFSIQSDKAPTSVKLDPEEKVILKSVKILP